MKFRLSVLFFLFVAVINVQAQSKKDRLEKYFAALHENGQFNGNVLIAEKGKIVYEKSFGHADFEARRLNTNHSTFPIASITKMFTATAILQLKEKGKLQINDPVIKYLQGFPYPAITIKHLLSHTSGLRPYDDFFDSVRLLYPDTVFTNSDILPRYAALKLPLLYEPGEDGNYDNINFIFLALVVEKLTGMPLQDYIKKIVLSPAGMTNTIFPKVSFYNYTLKEKKNLVQTYWFPHLYSETRERTDTISFVSKYWHSYNFKGFGELISTTEDLLKYDQALYNGVLLSRSTLKEAFVPVRLNNGKINPVRNGLGWQVEQDSAFGTLVFHGGGIIGLRSIFLRNITKHQTIIILDNSQNDVDEMQEHALKILNGQAVKQPGQSLAKLYGKVLVNKGMPAASSILDSLHADSVNYSLNEGEFNSLGYDLLSSNKIVEALETFKINTRLFPESWNVYDSYGEALLKIGQKEEAIKMYKQSIKLNPGNKNGRTVLDELLK